MEMRKNGSCDLITLTIIRPRDARWQGRCCGPRHRYRRHIMAAAALWAVLATTVGHGAVTFPPPRQAIDADVAPWNGCVTSTLCREKVHSTASTAPRRTTTTTHGGSHSPRRDEKRCCGRHELLPRYYPLGIPLDRVSSLDVHSVAHFIVFACF